MLLVVFTVAYLDVFGRVFTRGCDPAWRSLLIVAVLGVALAGVARHVVGRAC